MQTKVIIFTVVFGLLLMACSPSVEFAKEGPTASSKDFSVIVGDWQGTLTYNDYSSGEITVIASRASVTSVADNNIKYTVSYPNEPWEDSDSTINISEGGRLLEGHVVSQRQLTDEGTLLLITLHQGEDDSRLAEIRQTYGLSPTNFYIRKEVKFEGDDAFIFRNIYEFTRIRE